MKQYGNGFALFGKCKSYEKTIWLQQIIIKKICI